MTFEEILDQAIAMLQRRGRVTYQTLRLQFQLDEEHLEALKDAILFAHPQVVDAAGRGWVWSGAAGASPPPPASPQSGEPPGALAPGVGTTAVSPAESQLPDAERRQLTVMFCDLVDSTALATQLDPEELREIVRAYQEACAKVIARYDGRIAQYLSDGVLVYFGYPHAHEDDAERAVRAGLELITAVAGLKTCAPQQVRVGIATGLVVVGHLIPSGESEGRGLVGGAPDLAARLPSNAQPNMVVIAESTRRLLGSFFQLDDLGMRSLKGITGPVRAWAVLGASSVASRFEALHSPGLTALCGPV